MYSLMYFMALWCVMLTAVTVYLYVKVRYLYKLNITQVCLDHQQRQISALQRDFVWLASREEKRHQVPSDHLEHSPYNQAIEMVKEGASASEVAERCGISRSEVELIMSLYPPAS